MVVVEEVGVVEPAATPKAAAVVVAPFTNPTPFFLPFYVFALL